MTSQTKRKHSEIIHVKDLFDLCNRGYLNEEERFDLIRQWLETNKDDDITLKAGITYQDADAEDETPLHSIFVADPPLDIIQEMIKYAPEVLQMKDKYGCLPIHRACQFGASLEVIQALLTASPDTIKVTMENGWLSLHYACHLHASLNVVNLLIESYPEGVDHKNKHGPLGRTPLDYFKDHNYAEKEDENGMLPLHHVCKNGYSEHLIRFLIQTHPKSIEIKDNHNRTPLEYYTSFEGRQLCDEMIALLQPVNKVNSSVPAKRVVQNAEAPPIAQIENQPLPQMTEENDVEKRNAEMNDMKAEIKAEINAVKADIRQVQSDLLETKTEVSEIKTEVSEIKAEVSEIKTEVSEIKAEVSEIKTEVSEIKSMIGDMQRFLNGIVSG